jgi:hypothetical protein
MFDLRSLGDAQACDLGLVNADLGICEQARHEIADFGFYVTA